MDGHYNRSECLDHFKVLNRTNPAYVFQNPDYFYSNSTQLPQLTLDGCRELCGPKWGPYPDNGVRLFGWILPLVLLLANISYPAAGIGKKRFFLILRIIGDPISTIFSHLMILETWVRSSHEASEFIRSVDLQPDRERGAQDLVTEVLFAKARYIRSLALSEAIDAALQDSRDERLSIPKREAGLRTLMETGFVLAGLRVIHIRRSVFAIIVYVIGVVSVFVPAIGGSPAPSGGRVSPAQLLTFLLPLVLINNALGDVTSWSNVEDILNMKFRTNDRSRPAGVDNIAARHETDIVSRAVIGPWYPQQAMGVMAKRCSKTRRVGLAIIATFPILLSFAIATSVDITPPTGPSCRAIFNLLAAIGWCLSAVITACLVACHRKLDKRFSTVVLLKDSLIGLPTFVVVTASACGLFNSCFCSSGILFRGSHRAHVDLIPDWAYGHNEKVYIASVTVGLTCQIIFFAIILYKYRREFALIWKNPVQLRAPDRLEEMEEWASIKTGPRKIAAVGRAELNVGGHMTRAATA